MKIRQSVIENPILAILRGVDDEILFDYAEAIMSGGVRFFEIALNSPGALSQIRALRQRFGNEIKLGAGTAITVDRAKAALEAGAEFLLSPSTNEDVLAFCESEGVPMLPGALTPTDISICVRHGFHTIKLFPAASMPMNYIKNLKGPFDNTEYVAIGGVNAHNMTDFIKNGYLGVGLGSNILPRDAVENRNWSAASDYVLSLVEKIRGQKK